MILYNYIYRYILALPSRSEPSQGVKTGELVNLVNLGNLTLGKYVACGTCRAVSRARLLPEDAIGDEISHHVPLFPRNDEIILDEPPFSAPLFIEEGFLLPLIKHLTLRLSPRLCYEGWAGIEYIVKRLNIRRIHESEL